MMSTQRVPVCMCGVDECLLFVCRLHEGFADQEQQIAGPCMQLADENEQTYIVTFS